MLQVLAATHTGTTTDDFARIVSEWIAAAQHPRFKRPCTECVYAPMVELLQYLRANGFKTFRAGAVRCRRSPLTRRSAFRRAALTRSPPKCIGC